MSDSYELLDSGERRKLERVGPYLLDRPAPHAFWPRRAPKELWDQPDATHERHSNGGGQWHENRRLPESWDIQFAGHQFRIKPTPFGHLGLFPEQRQNWEFLGSHIESWNRNRPATTPLEILNLFAYTGGSTLSAARAGARVVHVDAAKNVVGWARENATLSGLESAPVRWIAEDAHRFLKREVRRGRQYDGCILDPPSFGRGKSGQVWKIEKDLLPLLATLRELLTPRPAFVLLSGHSPGFTPCVALQVAQGALRDLFDHMDRGEMLIPQTQGPLPFPTGTWCRLWNDPES
ncbi:MAG: class I SAM-dependent methyltransferase [Planctomycetota bacterium]|nr:class I SAM-dependent methyltransferase [Planctomycetota bacterium]